MRGSLSRRKGLSCAILKASERYPGKAGTHENLPITLHREEYRPSGRPRRQHQAGTRKLTGGLTPHGETVYTMDTLDLANVKKPTAEQADALIALPKVVSTDVSWYRVPTGWRQECLQGGRIKEYPRDTFRVS